MSDALATRSKTVIGRPHQDENAPNAQCGHCQWNLQDDVWESEPALLELYGVDPSGFTLTESTLLELKHPDDLATTRMLIDAIRSGSYQFSFPHRIFRDDGFVRHINSGADIVRNSEGRPLVLHVTVDVLSGWERPLTDCALELVTDGSLMLGLRAHVPEAYAEVFRRHQDTAMRAARFYLRGTNGVDDIVQDVFESLLRSPERFNARRGSLGTYISMLARTRAIDVIRSSTARIQRELIDEPRSTSHPVEEKVLGDLSTRQTRRRIEMLPFDERVAIELAFFGELSYRAVGERLGIPEGTAKSRIRSGLRHLRSSIVQQNS